MQKFLVAFGRLNWQLWIVALLLVTSQPVWADTKPENDAEIPHLSEIELPATSARMLVQSSTNSPISQEDVVTITGVKANPTDKGVEVILQTTQGEQLQITNRSAENNFIVDIPNAQLRLPNGDAFIFRSEKPVEGITEITVTNVDANTVRLTVIAEKALPTVELFDDNVGLVFGITSAATAMQPPLQPEPEQPTTDTQQQQPAAQQDEPIELVVTGEQDSYNVPNASTATRTNTPLRDIPQSIQVVPQEVLRDQNVIRLEEALRNVPGITTNVSSLYFANLFNIRGFTADQSNFLRNGLRDRLAGNALATDFSNVERVEVLLGPASVLYGGAAPGGIINVVTKQPLQDPFYAIDATIGNYDFYRGGIDLSGPLNDSRTVLYRLNASYLDRGSFVDFYEDQKFTISPTVSFEIGQRTLLTLEAQYTDTNYTPYFGIPAVGTVLLNPNGRISRNRFPGDPEGRADRVFGRIGYRLEHQFSDNWSLQNSFQVGLLSDDTNERYFIPTGLRPDNRTLEGINYASSGNWETYDLSTDLIGKFSTGSIEHQLVLGLSLNRYDYRYQDRYGNAAPIDLFDPVYGQPGDPLNIESTFRNTVDSIGIYVQDTVTLTDNLKLLLGGRFDLFRQILQDEDQSGDAFSPRLGIVYQPIQPISLYASYSRSFNPALGVAFDGSQFQPERGTQYEVGVKADLNEQLSATLAFYDLTRSNVLTADTRPGVPPGFSNQTGEQRSWGVELTVQGEILPGWNIIAGYAYTDAQITEDNTLPKGNRLRNIPKNAINLWTTYEIQSGDFQGLGFGLGLFFAGERQGDLGNTFQLPSYLRTDAAVFYKRDRFRAALNFRNLFNVDYFESAASRLRVYPGEPFTVQGTISWEF
ncbi:TonB-dependent siderophore receptor [Chlorogloeopsis sp. ULAP02]|uniref:TonB-dependent siderophore receptor n=1 Tax=Chlorogloeopsis sp. ULAP02 TaxID=3107926 RepID=UPI0031359982